jgi:hypothetical protein
MMATKRMLMSARGQYFLLKYRQEQQGSPIASMPRELGVGENVNFRNQ